MIDLDTSSLVTEIMMNLVMWLESATSTVFNTASQWMIDFGNNFFKVALDMCSGFILSNPKDKFPDAWTLMKGYATGDVAKGIAEDIVVVFFLISLVDYAISIRGRVDVEDIMKMFGRMFFAQILVFNYMDILEGLWSVCCNVVAVINPTTDVNVLGDIGLTFGTILSVIMVIMALVYMVVMIILSFKIITAFFEKYIWVFLMIPFGAPAFAVVVGTGQWNNTAKAYVRYLVGIICEFIAFALLIVLLGSMGSAFREMMITWMQEGTGATDNYLLTLAIQYLSNICFAGMVSGIITKLDSQVSRMLAL